MLKNTVEELNKIIENESDPFMITVSKVIIFNLDKIEELKIKDISDMTYYTVSSITKFCKKMGFNGWKDFKTNLILLSTVSNKFNDVNKLLSYNEIDILNGLKEISIKCINDIYNGSKESIIKLKEYIENTHKLYLYGVGFNQLIIKHFYKTIILLNKNCVTNEDIDIQKKISENVEEGSVHILFSFSGNTKLQVEIFNNLFSQKNKNITIVSITANPISLLAENSDLTILISENETPLRMVSYHGLFFIINSLISLLMNKSDK